MTSQPTEKKPKGFWAQAVKVLEADLSGFVARLDAMQAQLDELPALKALLDSPVVQDTRQIEVRLRRMEQTWESLARDQNTIRAQLNEIVRQLRAVERSQTRGA